MSATRSTLGHDIRGRSNSSALFVASFTFALFFLSSLTACAASSLIPKRQSAIVKRSALWKPSTHTTWNYQLTGSIDVDSINVGIWDIDLFDASPSIIDSIHANGKHVICYFSAGSFEDWRPDASKFQVSDKGRAVEDWAGESWLQIKSSNVRTIMLARLDLAAKKKCDGVDPDNVDGYDNRNGLGLTERDAIDYVTFLADATHSRNMAIGLKNSGSIVSRLVNKVDFSVQEQCVEYGDCMEFLPFIQQSKPVFHVEYSNRRVEKREAWKTGFSNGDNHVIDDPKDYVNEDVASSTSVSINDAAHEDNSACQASSDEILISPVGSNSDSDATGNSHSSACALKVPGFSSIVKNLDLNAWVYLCPRS